MASASFTLRAVDATKAAFASVQNSLQGLEKHTQRISKVTQLAFGGQAILGALNMMKQRLDRVAESGDEMGFSQDQVATAMQMERTIQNVLNFFMQLPLALAKFGINLKNAFSPLTEGEIQERINLLKLDRFKKEIAGTVDSTKILQEQFDAINMTQGQIADKLKTQATEMFMEAVNLMATNPAEGMKLQNEALAKLNNAKAISVTLDEQISEAEKQRNAMLPETQRVGLNQQQLIEGLTQRYSQLTFELGEQNIALETYKNFGGPVGAVQEAIIKKTKEQETISGQLNKLIAEQGILAREAGAIIANGFEDAILSGEKLRDVLRGVAQDLIRMVFQQQVTSRLAGGIGGMLQGKSFADAFRADGGPVSAGSSYIVGERGPELFVPRSSGSIVPNEKMTTGSGGMGGVTVNYNIAAGVSRGDLVPILEQERKRLKAEIPDMVRRGGGYRAAFA